MSTTEPGRGGGPHAATQVQAEPRTLMSWIVGSSLRFRHLVVAAAVGMMVLGVTVLPKMHVDVFPEFAPPRVLIQTACVGLSNLIWLPLMGAAESRMVLAVPSRERMLTSS